MRCHIRVLAVGLLATSALAQTKSPFFATVRGPDGKPLAGAEVTCVFTPGLLVPGQADVVRCTTDALGRARADLRLGLVYVAWAIGPVDATGTCCVSESVQLVTAGRVVDVSAWAQRSARRFAMPSAAAWVSAGAKALRWFPVETQDAYTDLPLPGIGDVALPPSPWATGCLALVDAAGELLVTTTLSAAATDAPVFAAPTKFGMTVTDDGERPVAGAALDHCVMVIDAPNLLEGTWHKRLRMRRAAVTGPDGVAAFFAPCAKEPLPVRASRIDLGWAYELFAPGDGAKSVTLPAAKPTSLRITGAGDATLAFSVRLAMRLHAREPWRDQSLGSYPAPVQVQGASTWLVHPSLSAWWPRVSMQHDGIPIGAVVDWTRDPPASVTLDLNDLQRVEVRVLGPDGGPAACVLAVGGQGGGRGMEWDAVVAADSAGRATLLLPAEGSFCVYATNGSAHTLALVDLAVKEPLSLRLEPLPTMRLLVRTADGKPVAGAHAAAEHSDEKDPGSDPLSQVRERIAFHLWETYAAMPGSGPDGCLDIPVFLDGWTAQVVVKAGTQQSEPFDLAPRAERTVTVK